MRNRAIILQSRITTMAVEDGEILSAHASAATCRREVLDRGIPLRRLILTMMGPRNRNEAAGFPQRLLHL